MKNWERYFGTPEAAMRMEVRMLSDGRRFRIAVSECNPFTTCAFESRRVRDFASWGRVPGLAAGRVRRRNDKVGRLMRGVNWGCLAFIAASLLIDALCLRAAVSLASWMIGG